ncbi:Fe-S cluster assembly protein SufD [Nocardia asteroides NBRC 15531]|uniref:Iron-sulfur cluster assembly protein SufD n=1 Tax=Nocardia asteroides NBRC 15531 TaxID=1110697 RepID=U5E4H4_NOCAS|nr:Fe-S cluster assembly protein SufD [Nocardia asteroides]TLF64267.1 Fe-S cluster assembly protein SufD [Nocardia asteroides NBRC 15531]UGT50628.1 Fe-S cluster assembly protein SufD [Nocardia asteroides]SFN32352.1 Iron-regulated ABC transporter permease protein SufD [Nocardia asteroides]VEG36549.1 FeS cluster assembly protein sufD [Nocardia asteroides]GAD84182.1 iron-sulfur cluster assembly protein SufD [Nocardia asteroides NBRC 15531]
MAVDNVAEAAEARIPAINKGEVFTSFDVNAFEVPSGRDEEWRFTPLRRLRGLHDGTAVRDGVPTVEVTPVEGVTVETVDRADARLGQAGTPADRVAAQAYSGFESATVVSVGAETEVAEPVTITVTGPGEGRTAYGHLQIRLGNFAAATVVLDQRGSGTYAENVEFVLGDSAKLTVVAVQEWNEDAVHATAHHLKLGRDATVRHFSATLGGDLVRLTGTVRYAGPGGEAELFGLYFADAGEHFEQRLLVDHSEPNCKSNVLYKGALQGDPASAKGDARTVWVGDVLIRAAAEGTDTYEANRNLVLTDGARADSVPNLEIETGEIAGAGHASATGRFDDEQLFYLRARGIPEDVARRLVVRGFFHEIIQKIAVPEVRERLEAAIEAELATVGI